MKHITSRAKRRWRALVIWVLSRPFWVLIRHKPVQGHLPSGCRSTYNDQDKDTNEKFSVIPRHKSDISIVVRSIIGTCWLRCACSPNLSRCQLPLATRRIARRAKRCLLRKRFSCLEESSIEFLFASGEIDQVEHFFSELISTLREL